MEFCIALWFWNWLKCTLDHLLYELGASHRWVLLSDHVFFLYINLVSNFDLGIVGSFPICLKLKIFKACLWLRLLVLANKNKRDTSLPLCLLRDYELKVIIWTSFICFRGSQNCFKIKFWYQLMLRHWNDWPYRE